ncbi:SET and MYND domain-containing protein 4-like [Lutzomyia longipalpis]|uniref:SET and MYND domain-containing protein 4-like n=1 Tax=Lutzomyia longipalpis TaxID=7200 RepID=UPI00248429AC|nr:SET and MYND domain-containing protein 4-like [Lutzomyia longipalpis]
MAEDRFNKNVVYQKFIEYTNAPFTKALFTNKIQEFMKKGRKEGPLIEFFLGFANEHNIIPEPASFAEEKSDAKAEEFRLKGNTFFKYKKNVEAIEEYNKSACYAVSKEKISLAIANRSAVFFEMKMFRECLESIRMAREYGYPEQLKEKLDRREAKCKEEVEKQPPKGEYFEPKIDLPVNEKIPFVAKCLTLREDKTFGRHIVTKEKIPAGTIIAIEKPYCKILADKEIYLRCSNCTDDVSYLLFPCDSCTHTMFCSKACQEEAMRDFHAIECPITGALFKLLDMSLRISFRLIIRGFLTFPDTETMAVAVMKIEREKKNVFSFDWRQELTPEELFTPINNMRTSDVFFNDYSSVTVLCFTLCIMEKLLKKGSPVFKQQYLPTREAEEFLKFYLFHKLPVNVANNNYLNGVMDSYGNQYNTMRGMACSPFFSLINHSCSPNVACIPSKGAAGVMSCIITLKTIPAGKQLFTSYEFTHFLFEKSVRRENLENRYNFICKCVACIKNYPRYNILPSPNYAFLQCLFTVEDARKCFVEVKDFLCKNGHKYPTVQLCIAEEELKFYLSVMCGNISLTIREKSRLMAQEYLPAEN